MLFQIDISRAVVYNISTGYYTRKNPFCTASEAFSMNFHIWLTSLKQIQTFVSLAAKQPFDVRVGNDRQSINGKDFMGMLSLDYTRPVKVQVNCSADEFAAFEKDVLAMTG